MLKEGWKDRKGGRKGLERGERRVLKEGWKDRKGGRKGVERGREVC